MKELKKSKQIIIIGIVALILVLIGSTYAFFTYSKTHKALTLTSGGIKATFVEGTNNLEIKYAYPISDNFAIQNLDKLDYIDFTVTGNVSDKNQAIKYEIYLTENSGDTLDAKYIKLYLTDNNKQQVVAPLTYGSLTNTTYLNSPNGKVIYQKTITGNVSDSYRLYAFIDKDYSQNTTNQTFSFKVNLYAYNIEG